MGWRHIDISRAQREIISLLDGQWHDGMVPHMIFSDGAGYETDRLIWHSAVNPASPDHVATSGITQPPLLAEAVCRSVNISEATLYRWKQQYGALELDDVKELKALRDENARLKRLVGTKSLSRDDLVTIAKLGCSCYP